MGHRKAGVGGNIINNDNNNHKRTTAIQADFEPQSNRISEENKLRKQELKENGIDQGKREELPEGWSTSPMTTAEEAGVVQPRELKTLGKQFYSSP